MAGTHARILHSVADKALKKAKIFLGSEVLAIESIGGSEAEPRVQITTAEREFEFDEVVVTVPLGCLKQEIPKFSPPLPSVFRTLYKTHHIAISKRSTSLFPPHFGIRLLSPRPPYRRKREDFNALLISCILPMRRRMPGLGLSSLTRSHHPSVSATMLSQHSFSVYTDHVLRI